MRAITPSSTPQLPGHRGFASNGSLTAPIDWQAFLRNLALLFIAEAFIVGLAYYQLPAFSVFSCELPSFQDFYAAHWRWVWSMCALFSPLALLFSIGED